MAPPAAAAAAAATSSSPPPPPPPYSSVRREAPTSSSSSPPPMLEKPTSSEDPALAVELVVPDPCGGQHERRAAERIAAAGRRTTRRRGAAAAAGCASKFLLPFSWSSGSGRRRNKAATAMEPAATLMAALFGAVLAVAAVTTGSAIVSSALAFPPAARRRGQQKLLGPSFLSVKVKSSSTATSTTTSSRQQRKGIPPPKATAAGSGWRREFSTTALQAAGGGGDGSPESQPQPTASDASEWKAVLVALKMYKAAYGDLRVPQRFVVPTMAPWPKPSWGMRLGKVVGSIRSTGKYIQEGTSPGTIDRATAEGRRQILENMGFVWSARQSPSTTSSAATAAAGGGAAMPPEQVPLEQLYGALEAYRDNVVRNKDDPWTVPSNFFVPDLDSWPENVRGLPLGRQLGNLKRRLAKNEGMREKFQSLGLADLVEKPASVAGANSNRMSANDIRFRNVYTALKTYKSLYGDLLVPQPFAVPKTSEWPEETWGLRLGARVNAIRSQGTFVNNNPERRQMLDNIGFVWSTPKDGLRRRGRKARTDEETASPPVTPAAPAVSSFEGDTGVPPSPSSMDSLFDGSFDFGKDFDFAQGGEKTSPTWGLVDGGKELQEAAMAAEEAARAEEEYLPPRTLADSLKEATERAMEVGVIEGMTANKRVIKGKREKDIPWFNDDFGDDFVFEDVVEALTVYKSIYGDFSNLTDNEEFVVPAPKEVTGFLDDDDDYDLFGQFDADASARAAAAIARYEEQGDVESSEDLIAAEVARLQAEVGQFETAIETETATSVSKGTATSTDQWPEHLAGMALGSIVTRIRDGSLEVKHLPERKAMLDAIDFDWGDPMLFIDVPFEKAMCAMYAYYLIRGDMFVYEDFVMPDEDPWPQALAGYEIGKAVKRIRELQNFLEAYHIEKVSLLRMIDFVWFPTMALPLDPNETEMNSEMLLLSAMGHPDYSKMIDIPMGLPDKIMADGPFFDTDDPKLWWRKWHNWEYVKDYWYQQGRRDNAYVLRKMGYPKMAAEHEAKYGPGLLTQINETLEAIELGIDDKTVDERRALLEKLNFYRQEMLGCTDIHPQDRNEMLADFDTHMLTIMKDPSLKKLVDEEEVDDDDSGEYEDDSVGGNGYLSDEDVFAAEDEEFDEDEDFEVDVGDELGLDMQ